MIGNDRSKAAAVRADLVGDIDLANADARGDLLCALVELCDAAVVVVNCECLGLLGSHGVAMMRRVHRHALARGVEVVWAQLGDRHRRVLHLARLSGELHLGGAECAAPLTPPGTRLR